MLYMVIETFRPGMKDKVYDRYSTNGRMLPHGLQYIDSWLEENGDRCFQLMESESAELFREWTEKWNDLVQFEIIPLVQSPTKAPHNHTD
jgi:hypothetical protein